MNQSIQTSLSSLYKIPKAIVEWRNTMTLGFLHKLFRLARLDWVPPRDINDMMTWNLLYMGFRNFIRGKTLWNIAYLTLIWIVWQERNARIFEDKWRMPEMLWDLVHFFSSFWAFCTDDFKGIPLNVIQPRLAFCMYNTRVGPTMRGA